MTVDSVGSLDCMDLGAADPLKSEPGFGGCGVADTDVDLDAFPTATTRPGHDGTLDYNENGVKELCDIFEIGSSVDINGNGVPDECECIGDLDESGVVDAADLAILLGAWGPCAGCTADVDASGIVDGNDLAIVLGAWGACRL